MNNDKYSSDDLLKFLDYAAKNGLLKPATASSRKAATARILSVLNEKETENIGNLDVDAVFSRFANLNAGKLKPDSLAIYRSRFRAVLGDFKEWRRDPSVFKPSRRARSTNRNSPVPVTKKPSASNVGHSNDSARTLSPVFPVPIRDGLIVEIVNLPNDLTPQEAAKIAAVVNALAISDKTAS